MIGFKTLLQKPMSDITETKTKNAVTLANCAELEQASALKSSLFGQCDGK